jgi:hypothetical protein
MSDSVGFDASRLNAQPGDVVQKIGEAGSILSGNQARAKIVRDMAKRGGRTKIEAQEVKQAEKDNKAADKLLAKTKFNLKVGVLKAGNKAAVKLADKVATDSLNLKNKRKNAAIDRKNKKAATDNYIRADQQSKSKPAAGSKPRKPAKPQAPRQNKSVGAPKPPRPTK